MKTVISAAANTIYQSRERPSLSRSYLALHLKVAAEFAYSR
jgi:hypothetical protein